MELDISYTGISGELPDSIGTLSSLNILYLYGCQFSGSIPDSIGNLAQIRTLWFSGNHFTGHIPSTISKLKHLTHLYLSDNSLGGAIPHVFSNLQELVSLDLSNNNFTGPFPSSILNLTSLRHLNFSHNSLNGTIHSWVFSLPSLLDLYLHHNQFSRVADEIQTNPTLVILYLSYNQLNGPFPRSLVNLTSLDLLDFSSNNITGDVGINITFPRLSALLLSSCELMDFPHFLRNVKTLMALDISNNKIRGQILNWFSGMRWDSLLHLNLSHNSLTGHLQQFHYYSLESLDLKFNFLQGPLPSSICNLRSLRILDLSRNNFSNSIPNCLGSMANLTVLDLRRNNFSGSLPLLCTQSTSLTTIVLNSNQLEGSVPVSLLNCVGLKVLDLGNNAINDAFPAWLGTLEDLQVLILKSNKFHGPTSARKKFFFPRLRIFDLSHNAFNGSLPAEVFRNFKAMIKNGTNKGDITYMKTPIFIRYKIIRQLEMEIFSNEVYEDSVRLVIKGNDMDLERISTIDTAIDLSSNHFEGDIPKSLKDLSSLRLLNLSHNNLKGDIPMELGQLNTLEALDLSWNQLTGKIPQELSTMNFLAFLNLSQNHLVGHIPQGSQFSTFENDSYDGNLDLCGPPLSKECGTSDSSHVPQPLESEKEEAELYLFSGFTWESVVIGYSFGLVVGTVMWSLMFNYRKPKWLHVIREELQEVSISMRLRFQMEIASALLQFKQHFEITSEYVCHFRGQASFPKIKSWNESRDCCTWDGVTCDMLNGHVIGLDLSCSLLKGTIHPNSSLFHLHHLQILNLAYNNFSTSSIPHNIGRLTNLRNLNLSYSYFDGKIPTEISYLSNLVSLDLSPPYKYGLQLDQRTFEAMLHNLANLEVLSLSFVNISSPIPVNISSSLRYVDLEYTNLRGVLTESFFLLPNLGRLKLGFNALLKGVLPKIHPSSTLLELDISYTGISGISGELPHSIGTFRSLNNLNLVGCQFSGAIPDSIGNLTQIRKLRFWGNHFTGHIP
ncbi:receptor-like protein 7 [Solanum stenotomum]|uniref:receptor-like protein 7 n=1 Tax=Solanum stenotomum TaxID=172797 RepID=UPI0020D05E24|nr:receptor-like protein 7 [Solanum stenotomum]